jgi:hypothetical protein
MKHFFAYNIAKNALKIEMEMTYYFFKKIEWVTHHA